MSNLRRGETQQQQINWWWWAVLRAKMHGTPPVGHATAWRPLDLSQSCFAQKVFWSVVIKCRSSGFHNCYGPVAITRCLAKLHFPISQDSMKRLKLQLTSVDSLLKVAYSQVPSDCSRTYGNVLMILLTTWVFGLCPEAVESPIGYDTAQILFGLGRCHLACKVSGHDPISRWRNHLPRCYGPVAIRRLLQPCRVLPSCVSPYLRKYKARNSGWHQSTRR